MYLLGNQLKKSLRPCLQGQLAGRQVCARHPILNALAQKNGYAKTPSFEHSPKGMLSFWFSCVLLFPTSAFRFCRGHPYGADSQNSSTFTLLHPYTFTLLHPYTFTPFHLYVLTLFHFFLTSCTPTPEPTHFEPAFYHWQTQLEIDSTEQHYVQSLNARRLYVKFFDVAWEEASMEAVPQASLERVGAWADYDVVPTVFITNQTMLSLAVNKRKDLAERILQKITSLWPGLEPREIQLDCDWTEGSRDAYFQLLELVRERLPATTKLSVTLRLHQYRYSEQTGVPPADRVMLMFYNMGDLTEWQEPNSILNVEKARPYLQTTTTYPLPLDLALPIFNWGVLFREGKMIKLLPGLTAEALTAVGAKSLDQEDGERFEITKSTYIEGYYLYRGDQLRLEAISPPQLMQAALLLRSVTTSKDAYLSFYHLDSALLSRFAVADLQDCLTVLQNEKRTARK